MNKVKVFTVKSSDIAKHDFMMSPDFWAKHNPKTCKVCKK